MNHQPFWKQFALIQALIAGIFVVAFAISGETSRAVLNEEWLGRESFRPVPIERKNPLRVTPLYDRPDLVSDEDLAAVLQKIVPRFDVHEMKPNFIEHALRTWGVDATFQDPSALSGQQMLSFLTDYGAYIESWGEKTRPLLEEESSGVRIRWGTEKGASYHHDHLIASVTEAGAPLDTPVFLRSSTPKTLNDVVQQSLRDFRLDEREVEWTATAFGLWIPPTKEWVGGDGRQYSFDLLAKRLLRGHKQYGTCSGTHRVYSLMLLVRIDDEYEILSQPIRHSAWEYLEVTRDAIIASQFEDGHWPSNWPDGLRALEAPADDAIYQQVIATGHHLEWLSIAPPELQPGDESVRRAVDWIVSTTKSQTDEDLVSRYTFFSHVGSALANWRSLHPADFWKEWEQTHPFEPADETATNDEPTTSEDAVSKSR